MSVAQHRARLQRRGERVLADDALPEGPVLPGPARRQVSTRSCVLARCNFFLQPYLRSFPVASAIFSTIRTLLKSLNAVYHLIVSTAWYLPTRASLSHSPSPSFSFQYHPQVPVRLPGVGLRARAVRQGQPAPVPVLLHRGGGGSTYRYDVPYIVSSCGTRRLIYIACQACDAELCGL